MNMARDMSKYVVTSETEFVPGYVDLDSEEYYWPDGRRMTEANTEEYTVSRAAGRPSMSDAGSSPHVAFRISKELRKHAQEVAEREGRTVSALAREALETYIAGR
jgi:predicted HicB family RNase H-like nuclease